MVSINSKNGCLWALSRRQMVLRQRQGRAAPVVLLTATGEATKGRGLENPIHLQSYAILPLLTKYVAEIYL